MNETIQQTGAVIMGKRMFELGDPDSWATYEFQVPIFVVTHHPPAVPPAQGKHLTFTFVTDGIESVAAQAAAAAGDKAVQVVGGPGVIRQLLGAGLVDELHIDVMPVLLGAGLRLFEDNDLGHVELEKLGVREVGVRTNLRFRVKR